VDILVLGVGKLRPAYRALCDQYLARLERYASVREEEVKEASRSPAAVQLNEEAQRLGERLPPRSVLVALDREGVSLASPGLAERMRRWQESALPLTFVIGGSHGLAEDFRQAAAFRWSLGALTLPHELARVVVFEQLFRAFTILKGDPYHK
jgi:23S rRNA (pseudouridine1915-N3)-methyltransferase